MSIHQGHRERKKKQFLRHGLEAFADHEVLELLLFYALPRVDTNPIAHRLLEKFGSLDMVFSASVQELTQVEGVGEHAALLLTLVPQAYRRSCIQGEDTILNTTQKSGEFFLGRYEGVKKEVMYQVCLDMKCKVIRCVEVGKGGISKADVDVREIMENAILYKASAVILAHNHPSGVALPSREDEIATLHIKDALSTLGVELLDHVIVADGDFVSLADNGFFQKLL